MTSVQEPLIAALLAPEGVAALSPRAWNDLLWEARANGLLARLGVQLIDRGLIDSIPAKARAQVRAACIAAESSQTAVRFEINRLLRALGKQDTPVILLKGAAYMMAGLRPARGRLIGDVDLMVPREQINSVEQTLVAKGWVPADLDEYDQRYYRQWTHEIPPLQNPERETPLDIHHTIVPLTSRVRPNADALLAASVPLADPRLRVLGPADMVLHSAVHLFNDEVGKPLRDLFDLHDLLCHFGVRDGFWDDLVFRARLHGLGRSLYYMLRHTRRMLGTSVPLEAVRAADADAPGWFLNTVMDWLFLHRFLPEPLVKPRTGAGFAQWLYYVRSHWLRMPPLLLARHLTIKAVRRIRERTKRKPEEVV
jgi:hypothetical protein